MCEMNDFHFRVVLTRTHAGFWHKRCFACQFQAPVSLMTTIMITMTTARAPIMHIIIFLAFRASYAFSFRFCSAISAACSRL